MTDTKVNISTNGTAYTLSGPDKAPLVVLIHGLGLTRDTWADHLPALEQDFRVLNYDLWGHGQSAAPPQTPSLTVFAVQLRGLLDELGCDRVILVGFSLGGMINRRFAMDYPERVIALGILNSPHERDPELQQRVEQQAAQADAGGPAATLDAALARWFTPDFLNSQTEVIAKIRGWLMANDPTVYAQCRQVLANGVIELIRPQPAITHPTLVITCEYDSGSTPAMSYAIASEIAGADVIIMPGLRHLGLVEQPNSFIQPLTYFLTKL